MRPITVVMDADGVFVDFVGGVLEKHTAMTGKVVTKEELPDWDIFDRLEALSPGSSLSLKRYVAEPGFCAGLKPLPGALDALSKLLEHERRGRVRFHIATSPWDSSPTWMHERAEWLEKHGLHRHRILHTAVKDLLRCDVFVDDKLEHVTAWQAENPNGLGYLWENAQNLGAPKDVPRLRDWASLFHAIDFVRGRAR